ncbi:MAG TPA: glycosyltransferase [Tepidisphaeraceae bacterium]|nr:glycosyltransferase [Tepidisphaeraceae bacterium]
MKLSILIPVYNERYLVGELVHRALQAPLQRGMDRELVIVDDGSTDGTSRILEMLAADHPDRIKLIRHAQNRGKGAAIRTAIEHATGTFCIFQDADLEYDPAEYARILEPLLAGRADVVYGSRFLSGGRRRVFYFWHSVGNRVLTTLSNIFTNLNLSDVETCYKAFRTEVLKTIPIRSNGFGIEMEITAKVAKRGMRVYEVPISYDGRTYLEGKKITWRDGVHALYLALKYFIVDDLYDQKTGHAILASLSRAHRFNRWMADTLRPYLGDRILEVGAGIGNLTAQFLPRDRYIASDCDELHLNVLRGMASRRLGLNVARVDAISPGDFDQLRGDVDTVVCLNVLEHISESDSVLQSFHNVLRPGGRAIILVPQGPWLYSPLDSCLSHVKRYTRQDLNEAVIRAGFEVETLFDFNRIGAIGWLLNGKVLRRRQMAKYQLKLFDSLVWLWRRIDRLLPWRGLSVVVVARKPKSVATESREVEMSVGAGMDCPRSELSWS